MRSWKLQKFLSFFAQFCTGKLAKVFLWWRHDKGCICHLHAGIRLHLLFVFVQQILIKVSCSGIVIKNKCIWTLKLWSVTVLFLVSYYCPMDGQWALKVFRNHKFAVLGSGFLTFTRCKCPTWLRWCWIFSSAFQKSLPIDENWKVQYQEYLANIYILLQQTKWSRSKTNTLLHFHQGKNDNCL